MPLPDETARQRAVNAPAHVFVWASAGTGKTYLLTQRALRFLLHAPFETRAQNTPAQHLYTASDRSQRVLAARFILQRFVLTTFTRKAAAEMQTRLFGALNEIARAHDFNALPEIARPVVPEKLLNAHDFPALRAGAEALAELATELQVSTLHSFAARLLRRHPAAAGIGPDVILAEE
ncbi:MAG: UvrD-helicase domain-containing protein, partial [Verrucomicrobiae bacterium]|nr:UvrD-helicase domain-containing protein [Verrucomicrobiae bacterium]